MSRLTKAQMNHLFETRFMALNAIKASRANPQTKDIKALERSINRIHRLGLDADYQTWLARIEYISGRRDTHPLAPEIKSDNIK